MRLILSFLLSVTLCSALHAQKRLKSEIIKSTGDTMYSTSEERIYIKAGSKNAVAEYLKTTIYRTNNRYSLCFSIQTGRSNIFSIGSGSMADITLQDGTVVSVPARGNHQSKGSIMNYGSYVFAFYELNAESRRALKASGIKSIRINASLGPMDYEIKEKFADTIQEQLAKFEG